MNRDAHNETYQPEEQLQALFRSCSNYMVYRLRREPEHPLLAVVEVVSPSIRELMGVEDPQDLSTWFARVHPEDRGRLWDSQKRCFQEDVPFDEILRIELPTGEVRHIHVVSHPVRDTDGSVTHYNGLVVDVTERMKLVQEAEKLRQRLEVAKQWETVGSLAATLGHDLNNLLQAILGSTLTLSLSPSEPELREHQEDIDRLVGRGVQLTRGLTKKSLGGVREKFVFDLGETLDRVAGMVSKMFVNLRVKVEKPESLCRLTGDEPLIERALLNLALNAAHATGESGEVVLGLAHLSPQDVTALTSIMVEDARIALWVADNGSGIPEAIRPRIFEKFFTTKPADKGTGLGLVSVQRAATEHGGTVWVQSRQGDGSTFYLLLPPGVLSPSDGEAERTSDPKNPSGRVLVVEDEPTLRILLARMLSNQGFEVASTADSAEAFDSLNSAEGNFKAMVTDIFLPGSDGFDFIRQARQMYPLLPILVTSGDAGNRIQFEVDRLPRCRFLAKPFNPRQLAHELNSLLQ